MFVASPIESRDDELSCGARAFRETDPSGVFEVRVGFPTVRLGKGESESRSVMIYGGPKLLDALQAVNTYDDSQGGRTPTSIEKAMDLRLAFLAVPMLKLLKVFHGWIPSWPIAIALLTLTVKLATLYWTHKSMRSMKAMGRLKPEMDKIREKFGEDRQRMNVEMMNLYKTHKINPLSGCLPMLLQMPVWIALYEALGAAADLYQVRFLWMPDLTAPDPIYILPILMTVTMFLQQKLSPTTMDSAQQKMMMYMMPLMFGAFSLVFPAGLTIYIFTNTLLGMLHQLYMNRTEPAAPAPAPAAAAASGGAQRGPLPRGRKKG
jgi:YidC/Oxa1 family membrane protein insertase